MEGEINSADLKITNDETTVFIQIGKYFLLQSLDNFGKDLLQILREEKNAGRIYKTKSDGENMYIYIEKLDMSLRLYLNMFNIESDAQLTTFLNLNNNLDFLNFSKFKGFPHSIRFICLMFTHGRLEDIPLYMSEKTINWHYIIV